MPIHRIKGPDGNIHEINAPEGATPDQLIAYVKENMAPASNAPSGLIQGAMDPIHGLAQLLEKSVPEPVRNKINQFNNWLVEEDIAPFLSEVPEGGVSQMVADREKQYQQARSAAGETGFDWGRLGGNIASPANVALIAKAPAIASSLTGRIAQGAGLGVAGGGMQPVSDGDFWTEKGKQAGAGAVAGGVLPAVAGGVARVVRPNTSAATQALQKAGVTPSVGAALGGAPRRLEDAATSMPIVGDAIRGAKVRSIIEFNRAAGNKVLQPIGKTVPKSIDAGHPMVSYVSRQVSDSYNDLLPRLGGQIDDALRGDLNGLRQTMQASNLPPRIQGELDRIINNEVINRFTSGGRASGETLKLIESKLGKIAKSYARSDNYDRQLLGDGVEELQASLRRMIERVNPEYQGQLGKVNRAWALNKVLEKAASYRGSKEGVFSPSSLAGAARASDPTKTKTMYARGNALMQDLAEAGEAVLPSSVPDSGTPLRALTDLGLLGGTAYLSPPAAIGLLGAHGMYAMPPLQRAVTSAFSKRPEFAGPLADTIRRSGPMLAPGLAPLGYSGLQKR